MLALWLGCTGKEALVETGTFGGNGEETETGEDGGANGQEDSSGESGTGDSASPDRPSILSADAWCYFHDVGETFWNWEASCQADDPQGVDTLDRAGVLTVSQSGTEIASYALSCDRDLGVCSTAFREDYDDILCSQATSYSLRFVVVDEDEHASDPYVITGRAK